MGTTRLKQVQIYVGKHFRLFVNERGWKTILFAAVIAFLISSVLQSGMFSIDNQTWSGFFALISACIWIGIFNSIQTVCKERGIIKREHRSGLHISSYVASHMIFQAAICLAEAIIMVAVNAVFLEFPDHALLGSSYLEYFITYFLVIYSADLLALAVSSIVKTPATAMTVMPFLLIIQLVFSGVLFPLQGGMARVADFTISKWGLNAACTSADYDNLESAEKLGVQSKLHAVVEQNNLPLSREMVDEMVEENFADRHYPQYAYSMENLAKQWGILLIHCAVYAIVSVVALEFIDRDKR